MHPDATTRQILQQLAEKDLELKEKQEELEAQRGMLSAALDEAMKYNESLTKTLEELKVRNSELERLLYHSSHSLRSPVTSMLGILNLMEAEKDLHLSSSYSNHMMSNAKRMLDVLNALSTLYKLTTKDLHLSEINIDQTLRKVIDSQQAVAAGHNVTLHYSMDDPAPMVSDPDLLTELVKQVVQNGIYFRNTNVAGLVQVVGKIDEGLLHLDVLDDGDGIAPEIEANIFDIFFRGSEKSGGSGLGLYIARKICQLLGGSISFSSEYDKTTFSIELPTKY